MIWRHIRTSELCGTRTMQCRGQRQVGQRDGTSEPKVARFETESVERLGKRADILSELARHVSDKVHSIHGGKQGELSWTGLGMASHVISPCSSRPILHTYPIVSRLTL